MELRAAEFRNLDLTGVDLQHADLRYVDFTEANLKSAILAGADLRGAILTKASLEDADLRGANVKGANFFLTNLSGAKISEVRNLSFSKELSHVVIFEDKATRSLNNLQLVWWDKWLSWEMIREVGQLSLFIPSYVTLGLLSMFVYIIAIYNNVVVRLHNWSSSIGINSPNYELALLAKQLFSMYSLSEDYMIMVVSTILLALASTIYSLFCPLRIQEFSIETWRDSFRQSPIYYWADSWRWRWLRIICGFTYLVGGLLALFITVKYVVNVSSFIIKNSLFTLTRLPL